MNDLNTIIDFISQFSVSIAEQVTFRILFRANQLSTFPESGQIEPLLKNMNYQYRYLIEGHCKIIYKHEFSKIFIARIFDTRQNPTKLQGKIHK